MRFALTILLASSLHAQSTQPPQFEVASIKRSDPGTRGGYTLIPPGGERYAGSNPHIKSLIQDTYRLQRDQITGGPS
jgi:uncharacterized protein (TIGR03435 family)